ncbi:MAG: RDD family protein [Candidatus Dormibacteria bacterium]
MPGRPPPPLEPPEPRFSLLFQRGNSVRASDADREQVTSQLAEHHVAGRLTTDELRERTNRALDAHTIGDLKSVLADLPGRLTSPANPWEALLASRSRGPFPGLAYGGFWAKVGGLWADVLVITGISAGLDPLAAGAHLSVLLSLTPAAYFVGFWGAVGRSPGMWLVGIRVVRAEDGGRLGFRRSLLRAAGYLLDLASCFVGFGWAAVDAHRQGWHDKIAGSYVVRRLR